MGRPTRPAGPLAASLVLLALLASCSRAERPLPQPAPAVPPAAEARVPGVKIGRPYTVFGRTYVPEDDRGYDETGIASWYGPTFDGKPTANGETYDQDALTAAHKTLPMPSWVEVRNLDNGRVLTVRINDRGPFVDGRIIDLSRRSAQLLGVDGPGLARVRVRRVFPPGDWAAAPPGAPTNAAPAGPAAPATVQSAGAAAAPPPTGLYGQPGRTEPLSDLGFEARPPRAEPLVATPVGHPPAPATAGGRLLQVAAVSDEGRARALASILADFAPAFVEAGPGGLWRVRLGPVAPERVDDLLWEVRTAGYPDTRLLRPGE